MSAARPCSAWLKPSPSFNTHLCRCIATHASCTQEACEALLDSLTNTVELGHNNSLLVVGPRGCGKTLVRRGRAGVVVSIEAWHAASASASHMPGAAANWGPADAPTRSCSPPRPPRLLRLLRQVAERALAALQARYNTDPADPVVRAHPLPGSSAVRAVAQPPGRQLCLHTPHRSGRALRRRCCCFCAGGRGAAVGHGAR